MKKEKLCDPKKIQQGDVALLKVDVLPKDANKIENKVKALAFGEVTGSRHVADGDVEFFQGLDGRTWLQVLAPCELKHIGGDHLPVPLDKGIYEYGIVLEYDYELEEARKVAD